VFWDHEENPWTDAIVEGLSERGIPVHRISGILPGIGPDDLAYVLHDKNRHPNPRAYETIAEYIAREIVDADGPVETGHDADVPADR
jgi:hypothetical protein